MSTNWRGRDVGWFVGFIVAAGITVNFAPGASIVFGGFALLQLTEAVLHALADAFKGPSK